ncbi:MAG TPA: FAD:protein FMN transferase [Thermoanaerobaculia bacterium]|nr:FAD:protein FMN transferase [Thermoanaerobaculia bacterium]
MPASVAPRSGAVERRLAAMGTTLSIRVESPDRARALDASEAAAREIARVEDLLSTWKPGGVLDRLNRVPAGQPIELTDEVASLLRELRAWSSRTKGAFDPTVLPLVRAWDLRGEGRVPDETALSRALSATGWRGFALAEGAGYASRTRSDASLDEGAWAKGYALDRARQELARASVRRATVDLGGQVMVLGASRVDIADPVERRRITGWLDVEDASVSTSGNSERFRLVAGRRIGHILDPRTGRPAPDFGSATAVAPSGLAADILSTAFFVLGPEQGLTLSGELRRAGFPNEALFLIADGGRPRAVATPGLHFHHVEER